MFKINLRFWQNGRGILRATAVTQGEERTPNKSQHTKLTLEKEIFPPLLPGFELATFRSRVRRSNQQAIPAADYREANTQAALATRTQEVYILCCRNLTKTVTTFRSIYDVFEFTKRKMQCVKIKKEKKKRLDRSFLYLSS